MTSNGMQKEITVFTDGASKSNPGPGGFAAIIISPEEVVEIGGSQRGVTNNQMELKAVVEALKYCNDKTPVTIFLDSAYVYRGANDWLSRWQKTNWQTAGKKTVLNKKLWLELSKVIQNKNISWNRISGHSGLPGNERADEIATTFASGNMPKLYEGSLEKYPLKDKIFQKEYSRPKREKKERSRAKAHSYISEVLGKVEVHQTWAETEKRVKGVSGARFKKSLSREDEKEIIKEFSKD